MEKDKVIFMKNTFEFGSKVFKEYAEIQMLEGEITEAGINWTEAGMVNSTIS